MILKGAEAARWFAKPDPTKPGILIFGTDSMRVALRRQEVVAALVGPEGEAEMRLTRLSGGDLRRDPAALMDAVTARGFFPGHRVVFVEEATDGLAPQFDAVLKGWRPGDAQLVVTAGELKNKTSALRGLFEKHPLALAAAIYDDPPDREEVMAMLSRAGLSRVDREAMDDLMALSQALDPGDFRQTVEKAALYKFRDETPLSPADLAAVAPMTIEAEVDDLIRAVADGRAEAIGPLVRRLEAQGTGAVTICIALLRHFRGLHGMASDPGGSGGGRMPARLREAMGRQAQSWGGAKLEKALAEIVQTDLTLRSSSRAPAMAVMERAMLRLAMMVKG